MPDPLDIPVAAEVAVCGRYRLWRQALTQALMEEPDIVTVAAKRSPQGLAAVVGDRAPAVLVLTPPPEAPLLDSARQLFPDAALIALHEGECGVQTGLDFIDVRACRYSDLADTLRNAIRERGGGVHSSPAGSPIDDVLDELELSFVQLAAAGCSASQIAAELAMSLRATGALRKSVYRKLSASSLASAVASALRQGLIAPLGGKTAGRSMRDG